MNLYQEEAPTANELARTMGCSRQNVKEILNSLEKKQMVRLEIDSKDKRKKRVYLTEYMQLMTAKYQQKETDFLKYLFEGVSDQEVDHTYNIISKIQENLVSIEGEFKI